MFARTIVAYLIAADLFWYQLIRQSASLLVIPMSIELGYSTVEKGWLLAAPSMGAILTQAAGSGISSLLGARLTVAMSLAGMAACCVLLPSACAYSFAAGVAILGVNGLAYGPMFPTNAVLLSRWMLPSERGWAATQSELAISIASTLAPLVVAALEPLLGWRACFVAVGTGCFAYAVLWLALAASTPAQCSFIGEEEKSILCGTAGADPTVQRTPPTSKVCNSLGTEDAITNVKPTAEKADAPATGSIGSLHLLLHPSIIALFTVHGVYNIGTLSINSWMPTYYADVLGLPAADAKLHLMVPHLVATTAKLGVPMLAAALRARGVPMLTSRRVMCAAGFGGTSAALLALPLILQAAAPPTATTACFCMALALTGLHAEGFRANYLDVTRDHVGLVSAVGNCLSSLAAMIAPLIVSGLVASTGSWAPVWQCIAASSLVATVVFAKLATVTPVEELLQAHSKKHD